MEQQLSHRANYYQDVTASTRGLKRIFSSPSSQDINWSHVANEGAPPASSESFLTAIGRAFNSFVRSVIELICPFARKKSVISDTGEIELQVTHEIV